MENTPFRPSIGLLTMHYAEAIQQLASDPDLAAATRLPHPYPEDGARTFIEMYTQEHKAGRMWNNVILNGETFIGLCGLINIIPGEKAEIGYWIGKPFWGKGFASFGVKMTLETAFQHLGLQKVYAVVLDFNKVSMHVLEKNGFTFKRVEPHNSTRWKKESLLHVYELTKAEWVAHRYGRFIDELHPDLQPVLAAELAAGNEVSGASAGWPKPGSILISLKKPFFTNPAHFPDKVVYREVNDTHYWKAEYATINPVHLIICPFE